MAAGERRRLIILGAVLGLLLAVFAAKTLLVGDDSAKSARPGAQNPFQSATTVHKATTTTKAKAKTTSQPPPDTFQVYATKNPFEPVIQVDTPTTTSPQDSTTTTPGDPATPTTTPSNEPPPGQSVVLIDVFHDSDGTVKARVQVGSTVYLVSAGETFADGSYRVVSLDEPCGEFLYGDSPFRLCEGEQTIK